MQAMPDSVRVTERKWEIGWGIIETIVTEDERQTWEKTSVTVERKRETRKRFCEKETNLD